MAGRKKHTALTAEEARAQREEVLKRQAEGEQATQDASFVKVDPERTFKIDPEHAKKIEKQTKRMSKIEEAAGKAKKRIEAITKLWSDDKKEEASKAGKSKRVRKYETVKVKVPYDRNIINFTTPELLELFGGWFTLTYAFSQPVRTDMVNKDGSPVMRDYYICSRDVSSIPPSMRPKKNATIKKLFDKDVYGYAIIAPASAFTGRGEEDEEE